jgi:phosphatidylserine/phosphatidylglycerophosphate/cardiolipin synthase-like enzyme
MKTKVLKKYQISSYLLELIDKAEEKVVLITPYVNVWWHLTQTIESALKRKVRIELYHRYYERDSETSVDYELDKSLGALQKMGVHCYEVKNLHTKLYLSEKSAIIASMNLYEHSSQNNEELGLLTDDKEVIKQLNDYVKDLKSRCEEINEVEEVELPKNGVCISCRKEIPFNPYKPFCIGCFTEWSVHRNPNYEEKFCHSCGDGKDSEFVELLTFKKPLCMDCGYTLFG